MADNEQSIERRSEKAKQLLYKKPLHRDLNMESIRNFVYEAQEAIVEIAYATQNEDVFLDAMNGDEEEAFAYRTAFSQLEIDFERFSDDLDMYKGTEELEYFDCFEVATAADCDMFMGYDNEEGDYFGIDEGYNQDAAQMEQAEKLKRLTKDKLIAVTRSCWRLALQFIALRSRYQDLETAIDIIRGYNNGLLQQVDGIIEEWDRANNEKDKFNIGNYSKRFERLISQLPDECWIR